MLFWWGGDGTDKVVSGLIILEQTCGQARISAHDLNHWFIILINTVSGPPRPFPYPLLLLTHTLTLSIRGIASVSLFYLCILLTVGRAIVTVNLCQPLERAQFSSSKMGGRDEEITDTGYTHRRLLCLLSLLLWLLLRSGLWLGMRLGLGLGILARHGTGSAYWEIEKGCPAA